MMNATERSCVSLAGYVKVRCCSCWVGGGGGSLHEDLAYLVFIGTNMYVPCAFDPGR